MGAAVKAPVACPKCNGTNVEDWIYSEQVIVHRYCKRLRAPDERDEGTAQWLIDIGDSEEIVPDSGEEGMLTCTCGHVFPFPENVAPWFG